MNIINMTLDELSVIRSKPDKFMFMLFILLLVNPSILF